MFSKRAADCDVFIFAQSMFRWPVLARGDVLVDMVSQAVLPASALRASPLPRLPALSWQSRSLAPGFLAWAPSVWLPAPRAIEPTALAPMSLSGGAEEEAQGRPPTPMAGIGFQGDRWLSPCLASAFPRGAGQDVTAAPPGAGIWQRMQRPRLRAGRGGNGSINTAEGVPSTGAALAGDRKGLPSGPSSLAEPSEC